MDILFYIFLKTHFQAEWPLLITLHIQIASQSVPGPPLFSKANCILVPASLWGYSSRAQSKAFCALLPGPPCPPPVRPGNHFALVLFHLAPFLQLHCNRWELEPRLPLPGSSAQHRVNKTTISSNKLSALWPQSLLLLNTTLSKRWLHCHRKYIT